MVIVLSHWSHWPVSCSFHIGTSTFRWWIWCDGILNSKPYLVICKDQKTTGKNWRIRVHGQNTHWCSVTCYGDCRKPQCIVHLNMEGRILNVLTTKDKMNGQWVRAALVAATVTVMATGTKIKAVVANNRSPWVCFLTLSPPDTLTSLSLPEHAKHVP